MPQSIIAKVKNRNVIIEFLRNAAGNLILPSFAYYPRRYG
jgi:hypothetical protein